MTSSATSASSGQRSTRSSRGAVTPDPDAVASALPQDGPLEQLQQSVDAIALEVERIGEAQRYTAKLMADRARTAASK